MIYNELSEKTRFQPVPTEAVSGFQPGGGGKILRNIKLWKKEQKFPCANRARSALIHTWSMFLFAREARKKIPPPPTKFRQIFCS